MPSGWRDVLAIAAAMNGVNHATVCRLTNCRLLTSLLNDLLLVLSIASRLSK